MYLNASLILTNDKSENNQLMIRHRVLSNRLKTICDLIMSDEFDFRRSASACDVYRKNIDQLYAEQQQTGLKCMERGQATTDTDLLVTKKYFEAVGVLGCMHE